MAWPHASAQLGFTPGGCLMMATKPSRTGASANWSFTQSDRLSIQLVPFDSLNQW